MRPSQPIRVTIRRSPICVPTRILLQLDGRFSRRSATCASHNFMIVHASLLTVYISNARMQIFHAVAHVSNRSIKCEWGSALSLTHPALTALSGPHARARVGVSDTHHKVAKLVLKLTVIRVCDRSCLVRDRRPGGTLLVAILVRAAFIFEFSSVQGLESFAQQQRLRERRHKVTAACSQRTLRTRKQG